MYKKSIIRILDNYIIDCGTINVCDVSTLMKRPCFPLSVVLLRIIGILDGWQNSYGPDLFGIGLARDWLRGL